MLGETTFLLLLIILLILLTWATYAYFSLYRKKKNPDYPLLPGEAEKYINKKSAKFFVTPFYMWKIIFEKHKDKDLNSASKRVRLFLLIFITAIVLRVIGLL